MRSPRRKARLADNGPQACKPSLPLQIDIESPSMPAADTTHLIRLTQDALDDQNDFSTHHLRLGLKKNQSSGQDDIESTASSVQSHRVRRDTDQLPTDNALLVRLIPDDSIKAMEPLLRQDTNILDVRYPPNQAPSLSSSTSSLANLLAAELERIFLEEREIVEYVLAQAQSSGLSASGNPKDSKPKGLKSLDADSIARSASRSSRSFRYASNLHITFSLFTPYASPSGWEIEAALKNEFAPLLDSLSAVSNFSIDTQVQLYAKFAPSTPKPEFDDEAGTWTLKKDDLSSFINAAEWPLSPSVGIGPTLNFIVYVPDVANTPLVVKEGHSTHWLVPQWGGVAILNDFNSSSSQSILTKEQIQPALYIFAHQLLSLMGAPASPPSLPIQLQTLIRIQAVSLMLSASSTMRSLARLTVKLPSIAIPETVSLAVRNTLVDLRETCTALKEGDFRKALAHAKTAEEEAEKGFFEKSMVGQVYFPDEHKVAVYLPLLGPIGVPLLMSGVKELKRLLAARRAIRAPA